MRPTPVPRCDSSPSTRAPISRIVRCSMRSSDLSCGRRIADLRLRRSSDAEWPWCCSCLGCECRSRRKRFSPATPLITHSPEVAVDQSGQLICSTVDGFVQGRGLVSDRDGLAAFEAGLHQATLVVLAALSAVLVAQVNLHSGDVIAD